MKTEPMVGTHELSANEVVYARGSGVLFVNDDGLGFVPASWVERWRRHVPAPIPQGEASEAGKCPSCGSPNPRLHPAIQHEGECRICSDRASGALAADPLRPAREKA